MDEELLKKIFSAAGVTATPEQIKAAKDIAGKNAPASAATTPSDSIKDGLASSPSKNIELKAFADLEAARRAKSASRPIIQSSTRPVDPNDSKYRAQVYKELGLTDSDTKPDPLLENRIALSKERNQAPQAEAARRQGIRDDNALDISGNLAAGKNPFADKSGNVVDPAQLQKELIAKGMDRNDANIAAGQRSRDMFDLPNAKSEGWGMRGGQRDAVLNAKPEDRMGVMESLKAARADNLKALTEQRLADPNRKPVGTVTEISSSDGTVLAKRGEGNSVATRGGTQGAVGGLEDRPGELTLTQAGENAIRDRLTVAKTEDGGKIVTGRYGTGMSGPKSMTDQLKERGVISKDFQLTPEQKLGQAPLPKEYAEGRAKLLAESKQIADTQGTVEGDAKPLLDRMAPGTAQAVDQKYDKITADLKQRQSDKLGSDFLNAYKGSGGIANPSKDAQSPGPRTEEEKAKMQAFLDKRDEELKRRLLAQQGGGL